MKHISIRVPWHDNKWNGHVCNYPSNNPFCLMLKNIFDAKSNEKENLVASKDWNKLTAQNVQANKDLNAAKDYSRDLEKQLAELKNKNKGCASGCLGLVAALISITCFASWLICIII